MLPGVKNPIVLRNNHPALHLLQALRNESHRTAVRFHRQKRRKRTFDSALLDLPGIGPSRRVALMKHFGGVAAIKAATVVELAAVDGIGAKMAAGIRAALHEE